VKIYQLTNPEDLDDEPKFAGGLSDIKALARAVPTALRKQHAVHEANVQTDKAGVVAMLNGSPIITISRTFSVTPRGGLKEEVS
jgi:hypothetical protein